MFLSTADQIANFLLTALNPQNSDTIIVICNGGMQMRFIDKLKMYMDRVLYGRNGFDEFSLFLMRTALLPLLISVLLGNLAGGYPSFCLYVIAMALIIWSLWRAVSKDTYARKTENSRFVNGSFMTGYRNCLVRFSQRKYYRFYRCPGCRKYLRVPKGKGKIRIHCPTCHSDFIKKT